MAESEVIDHGQRSSLRAEYFQTALAAAAFFLLLCSYYVLRPVRDTMAVHSGSDRVPWLFTATFVATLAVVPLFGWFVRRCSRVWLIPIVYGLMILCLLGFHVAFRTGITLSSATIFFIWLSFFNLLVISLFWSWVSDLFTTEQAERRYGYITAGGTAGAVAGPAITSLLARQISTANLLLISMGMLVLAGGTLLLLRFVSKSAGSPRSERPITGSILSGITNTFRNPLLAGIAGLVICYSAVSTVLYREVTDLMGRTFTDPMEHTVFFAQVDLGVNLLALTLQLLVTRAMLRTWGLRGVLCVVPVFVLGSLFAVGIVPTVAVFAIVQVLHRAGEFALSKPGREILFTTVSAEDRYKAKNFIDTAVYRANDTASMWLTSAIYSMGEIPSGAWLCP